MYTQYVGSTDILTAVGGEQNCRTKELTGLWMVAKEIEETIYWTIEELQKPEDSLPIIETKKKKAD